MNSRSIYILLSFTAVFILSSCKGINDIQFKGVDNIVFKGMENTRISFSANVAVSNPSSLSFKVSEVNLKTSIDGIYIGNLTSTDKIKIEAKSDSSYQAGFTLQMANLLTGASTLYSLSRRKQVTIEMQGFVKARSWFTTKKVDVNEKQLIDIPSFGM